VLAGHSAGGHLALWAAGRHRLPGGSPWRVAGGVPWRVAGGAPGEAGGQPWMTGVVALAPVSDLAACYRAGLGAGAAGLLLDGGPGQWPERYAQTDPARLLPLGVPVRIVHGGKDSAVPVGMSRDFTAQARAAGDDVVLRELRGCGHYEVIDPLSAAWASVLAAFRELAEAPAGTT
jgi:acetyl esterase/lipase